MNGFIMCAYLIASQTVDDFLASATMNMDLPRVQELLKDPNINVNFKNKVTLSQLVGMFSNLLVER